MPYAPEYLHLVIPGVRFEAWLYGRNSENPFVGIAGARDSVDDQLANGRDLCKRNGWPIVEEFKDLDTSASRHAKKARGDFEDLLTAIAESPAPVGVVRILVAYNASRYYRDLEAYVRLRNACMAGRVLLCYNDQVYDLSRRDDRKATALHAVDAEDEAEGIRDQNVRTAANNAQAGKPHGRLQFGYAREYAVVGGRQRCIRQYEDPVKGQYVLKALQAVDSGKSVRSVLRWLRSTPEAARPDGSEWSMRTVRIMLMNRAYLGERVHKGRYVEASWPAIKGLETPEGRAMFNRVTAKLTDPARRSARGTEISHFLSYLALCGECEERGEDALLCSQPRSDGRRPILTCEPNRDVSITEDVLDAFVEEAVITWFRNKQQARAALMPDGDRTKEKLAVSQRRINAYEEQLREAREQAEEFDDETGRFKLSAASLASMEQRLIPKLEQERRKLHELAGVSPLLLGLLEARDPEIVWNGRSATETEPAVSPLSLEQRREVVRLVVTVRLFKASNRGSHKLDPNRIRLSFVGEEGFRARPPRGRGSARAQAEAPAAALGTV